MTKKRVFIDLDHTIVDFNRGFYDAFQIQLNPSGLGMLPEDWDLINMVPEFYRYLPKFDYSDALIARLVEKFGTENLFFLTSSPPEYKHNAYLDKIRWARENIVFDIPVLFNNQNFGKGAFVENDKNDILIDDKQICINSWYSYGGLAIQFQEEMKYNQNWVDVL